MTPRRFGYFVNSAQTGLSVTDVNRESCAAMLHVSITMVQCYHDTVDEGDRQTVPESKLTVKYTRKINALGFVEYYSIIDMCNSLVLY